MAIEEFVNFWRGEVDPTIPQEEFLESDEFASEVDLLEILAKGLLLPNLLQVIQKVLEVSD